MMPSRYRMSDIPIVTKINRSLSTSDFSPFIDRSITRKQFESGSSVLYNFSSAHQISYAKNARCMPTYLLEPNIIRLLSKALTANIQTVLPNQSGLVCADATVSMSVCFLDPSSSLSNCQAAAVD